MSCVRPLRGFRARSGGVTFSKSEGFVDQPVEVNCGRCIGCRMDSTLAWSVRCVHEAQAHGVDCCFVTLTYRNEDLPKPVFFDVEGQKVSPLCRRDFQLFLMRLRKAVAPEKLRFFGCGEYGGDDGRPHFHACFFGLGVRLKDGSSSELLIEKCWGKGFVKVDAFNAARAQYTAGYVYKKIHGEAAADFYRRVNAESGEVFVLPSEFSMMSMRHGIGASWFSKFCSDVFPNDSVILNGREVHCVPRYYDKLLKRKDRVASDANLLKRRKGGLSPRSIRESKPERRKVREVVAIARLSQRERN